MEVINRVVEAVLGPRGPFFDERSVPVQVWIDIFLRCDVKLLITLCKVCTLFNDIISDPQFWVQKCERDGVALPPLAWRRFVRCEEAPGQAYCPTKYFDFKRIGVKRPYERNLAYELTPGVTLNELQRAHSVQFHAAGDGFAVESPGVYTAEHPDVSTCLATSYGWCERYFEIDLVNAGIEEWVLDDIRPVINVSEMYTCRQDCGAQYEFYVQLLYKEEMFDRMVALPRFKSHDKQWAQWQGGVSWEKIAFQFSEYPRGIRRVGILTRGSDTQFWAGHYGSKFANTSVVVEFPEEVRYKTEDEFGDPEKKFLGEPLPRGPFSLRVPVGLRGRFRHRRGS